MHDERADCTEVCPQICVLLRREGTHDVKQVTASIRQVRARAPNKRIRNRLWPKVAGNFAVWPKFFFLQKCQRAVPIARAQKRKHNLVCTSHKRRSARPPCAPQARPAHTRQHPTGTRTLPACLLCVVVLCHHLHCHAALQCSPLGDRA